jgi:Ca2+-binding RTX toxin-like protein
MAYVYGTTDADKLKGGYLGDTIYGYAADDALNGGWGGDTLDGAEGDDKLYGEQNDDTITGGLGKDVLEGGTGDDKLTGGADGDTLKGGAGDDTIVLGVTAASTASDTAFVSGLDDGKGDIIDGGSGIDALTLYAIRETTAIKLTAVKPTHESAINGIKFTGIESYNIWSGSGKDTLTGYVLDDYFSAGGGADVLKGMGGNDQLWGGRGNDQVYGGKNTDSIYGGSGDDKLYGEAGDDTLYGDGQNSQDYYDPAASGSEIGDDLLDGGAGNDQLNGYGGKDTLLGGAGDDRLTVDGGGDKADGGANTKNGFDTITLMFTTSTKAESFTFTGGALTLKAGATIKGFENLAFYGGSAADSVTGGKFDDVIYGGEGKDKLSGGKGADVLYGEAGDDTVHGNDGNDLITDGFGADTVFGDAGDDYITVQEFASYGVDGLEHKKDAFDGGAGKDTISFSTPSIYLDLDNAKANDGAIKGDTFKGIETFIGTSEDDWMLGSKNTSETLNGGTGDDTLNGRAGNDTLVGGGGADTMTGGAGKDVFDLTDYDYFRGTGSWKGDIITDFKSGEDKLNLGGYALGLPFPYVGAVHLETGSADMPAATKTGAALLFSSSSHELWFDADGKGTDYDPLLLATLEDVKTLKMTDIAII